MTYIQRKRIFLSAVFVVPLIFLGAGCGDAIKEKAAEKIAEEAIESGTGEQVDIDSENDTTTIETEEGTLTVGQEGTDVPADWSEDVPLPDDIYVVGTFITEEGETITFDTQMTEKETLDYFVETLTANGWKQTALIQQQGFYSYAGEKEGRAVSVLASADPDESESQTQATVTVESAIQEVVDEVESEEETEE